MHRIDSLNREQDKFGSGKDGFTEGDPSAGVAPTKTTDDWFDGVQEEVIAPIEDMGIALVKGTTDQLYTAQKLRIARGAVLSPWDPLYNSQNQSLQGVHYDATFDEWVAVGSAYASTAYILHSLNGTDWYRGGAAVATTAKAFALRAVACNGSLWVAVGLPDGTDAYIVTSPDGQAWTERANPKNFRLEKVAWNGSLWVAVGYADGSDAYMVTSPDGTTWTERANPQNLNLHSVCWAETPALFVAVGQNAYIATSPDGATWTQRTAPSGVINNLYEVCYSSDLDLIVAVGESAADSIPQIITSPDGVTWTRRTTGVRASALHFYTVEWLGSPQLFIGGGQQSTSPHLMYVSADGITWEEISGFVAMDGTEINDIRDIAHNPTNGLSVAVGDLAGPMGSIVRSGPTRLKADP